MEALTVKLFTLSGMGQKWISKGGGENYCV